MTNVTQAGIDLIKSNEGCKLSAYQDQRGIWTIGYGHTGPCIGRGVALTQDQAERYFVDDIQRFSSGVSALVKVNLTNNQFSAFVSLAYNIGIGAFSMCSALHLANTGDLSDVPAHIMLYDKIEIRGSLVVSNGLINRRRAECVLWATPDTGE